MTPATIGIGAIAIAITTLTILGIRAALHAAARRLERLLADALDHDWLTDIDDEYRQLIEEGA